MTYQHTISSVATATADLAEAGAPEKEKFTLDPVMLHKIDKAQQNARAEVLRTGKPADDGYGGRWYPPDRDGMFTVGPSLHLTDEGRQMKFRS